MSTKREQKFETSEKLVDSHREFLDMDTDEEDFGRQESPEVEEEIPAEPERPIFSEEDLLVLVKHVKDLTMHASYKNITATQDCDEIIREYFANPSHTVLTTFYEQNQLHAILNIPRHTFNGFTYIVRAPWQVYTPENFRSTVLFGTVNGNVKNTALKFMENMYAPIVLNSDEYSSFLRNDIFINLHKFIMHLMEKIYSPMGLTMLYVPKEHVLQTFSRSWNTNDYFLLGDDKTTALSEEDEGKRKLIERLEVIVWFWIKQMRHATKIVATREKIKNIQDEINYWNAKHTNLNYLRNQLFNSEVQLIINILKNTNSMSINNLEILTMTIDAGLKETSSNLLYLNIILESCKNLSVPEDVENSVTEILLMILFIWTESPFYSTTNNIKILCQALSSQIMYQCKEYIKLDILFGNNPEQGIQILKKCILCCNIYKKLYENLTVNVTCHINPDRKWDINKQDVFEKIDAFKQRCYDVIQICQALIVFRRNDKAGLIGGPRGINYDAYWQHIESLFYESLNDIMMHQEILFDISKFFLYKKIKHFKYTILQLENMVVNLINDIFENVKNIEEGIEGIYVLQIFKDRENLREILQNKWMQVWKIFNNEIMNCYTYAIVGSKEQTGINKNLLCISQYLKYQHSIITKASDWIGKCSTEKCTLQQYEYVLDVIDKRKNMFNISKTNRT